MKSESFHLQVTEASETRVSLSFAAEAAGSLVTLVPPHIRQRLATQSIDLEAISASARQREFAPGELFRFEEGPKVIRGWLA